jgi:ketosteroid isomerase-like protein
MSDDNVEVVRGVYARWAKGDMRASVDLFDPELVFESFMPDANKRIVSHGPNEVETFMREFLSQWRDYRIVGEKFRGIGDDRVLVEGHQAGTGRQSGVAVEGPLFSVWTFRDGRVTHLLFETRRQPALAAADLSE